MSQSKPTLWRLVLAVAVLTLAAVGLFVSVDLGWLGTSNHASEGLLGLPLPPTSPNRDATGGIVAGREVAPTSKALEAFPGEGAVPVGAPPPAPTAHAMSRTPAQTTKNETPKPQTQRTGLRLPVKPSTVAAAAIAGCTLVEGCTSSTPHVRPGRPAITCPEGWKETHKRLHLEEQTAARVKGYTGDRGEVATVKEGPAVLQTPFETGAGNEGIPDDTLLFGTWQLGEERLFGTFTQAQIPGMGTLPVCLVVGLEGDALFQDEHDKQLDCPRGLGICFSSGSKPGNARIVTRVPLLAVRP